MIEKALMIVIFMYIMSFSVLGVQYILGDVFNIEMTNFQGQPIKSYALEFLQEGSFNQVTENVVAGNFTGNSTYYDRVETFTTAAAYVAWELVTLLSGTYIFNFIYLMGIPLIFVLGFVAVYLFLVARAILAYIRGI